MFRFIILFLPIFFGQALAQDQSRILELMQAQEEAWNRGDIEAFMAPYENSDSLLFIGSKGLTRGWTNTLERYKKTYPDKASMGVLKFNLLKVEQISPDCIYVIGQWNLKRDKPASGHFTLLWRKTGGQWKITSDHSS